MPAQGRLRCSFCENGTVSAEEMAAYECRSCGSPLVPRIGPKVAFEQLIVPDRGMPWRYKDLLPVDYMPELDDHTLPRSVRSPMIESRLGIREAWLVDCTGFGTGTFKDLEAAIAVAGAKEMKFPNISTHSTGNTALAYRHYAQRAELPCAIYIPRSNADKLGDTVPQSPEYPVYLVDAAYMDVSKIAKKFALQNGWHHLGPVGWRLEGKASIAYWVYEASPDVDLIIQTVAGGYGPLGYERGFQRLQKAVTEPRGVLINRSYMMFQPADADTLSYAWRAGISGLDEMELRLPANPFEPTLQSTSPLGTLPMLRESMPPGTRLESVDPKSVDSFRNFIDDALDEAEISLDYDRERSAYIAIAGLLSNEIPQATRLALIVSGSRPFQNQPPADAWQVIR
jgi:Pyridoxal-phosphate dependent enzyme